MQLKSGVRILGLKAEILLGMVIAKETLKEVAPGIDFVVTACVDGKHKEGSLHYAGQAFDMRTHDLGEPSRDQFLVSLRIALGTDFDAIIEDIDTDNEHIHVEWQPKTGVNG